MGKNIHLAISYTAATLLLNFNKRLKFHLQCVPSNTTALVKFSSRRLDFAEKDTHEPSNTLHEKLDVHKFTTGANMVQKSAN